MKWKAFLLHLTHYDPTWFKQKETEKRFHRRTAETLIRAAAASGFNMLIIDIEDAVRYRNLRHIRKPYSVPMRELIGLATFAKRFGLEVVPKLNFSKSPRYRHSHWLWKEQSPPDSPALWEQAMAAVREVAAAIKPRFLHVGMDEDDTRSPDEYRQALLFLHKTLKRHKLRMMMWADCGHRWHPEERWKVVPAIRKIPRDVILMPWNYQEPMEEWVRAFMRWGFEVMGTSKCLEEPERTPGEDDALLKNTAEWLAVLKKCNALGITVTQWVPCQPENASRMLTAVRACKTLLEEIP